MNKAFEGLYNKLYSKPFSVVFHINFYFLGGKIMSKRNQIVITTPESKALKAMRERKGLSLRKLAEWLNISSTRVHQFELGKENISESYIKSFLKVTSISVEEWNNELGSPSELYRLRKKCLDKVNEIEESKLELVYGLLSNF